MHQYLQIYKLWPLTPVSILKRAHYLKKGGYSGFGLSIRHNFVSAQCLEQIDRISPNFVYVLIVTRSRLIVTNHFLHICNRVMALD